MFTRVNGKQQKFNKTALHNFILQTSVMWVIAYGLAKANSDISEDTTDFSILQ